MSMCIVNGFHKRHRVALWWRGKWGNSEATFRGQDCQWLHSPLEQNFLCRRTCCISELANESCCPRVANGLSNYIFLFAISLLYITTCASWLLDWTLEVSRETFMSSGLKLSHLGGRTKIKEEIGWQEEVLKGRGRSIYQLPIYLSIYHLSSIYLRKRDR